MNANTPKDIDEYIAGFPDDIQPILNELRTAIKETAPDASETISYGMPTFKFEGNLVHFAAFKNHIGFYPAPAGIEAFQEELAKYRTGKGTLRFPLGGRLPLDLIRKIVRFRVKENLERRRGKTRS